MVPAVLSDEEKVKRFLYLCSFSNTFVAGNVDKYSFYVQDLQLLTNFAKNKEQFIKLITDVNGDPNLPKRESLFFALAAGLVTNIKSIEKDVRHEIAQVVLNIHKTDEELFTFIKYYTVLMKKVLEQSRFPSILKTLTTTFYKRKTPLELAQSYCKAKSYHSWTHKDLLKLCHYKPETPLKHFVVQSILFNLKNITSPETYEGETKNIANYLLDAQKMRETCCEIVTSQMMGKYPVSVEQINSALSKSPMMSPNKTYTVYLQGLLGIMYKFNLLEKKRHKRESELQTTSDLVWSNVILTASIQTILQSLPKFHKLGFFKSTNTDENMKIVENRIIEALRDPKRVAESGIHPLEVFIYLKTFEKGGKPMDPCFAEYLKKLAESKELEGNSTEKKSKEAENKKKQGSQKCEKIIAAINSCLDLSYKNMKATGKRMLITVDNTVQNKESIHNKHISSFEASVFIAYSYFRAERNVTLAVFNDKTVTIRSFAKGAEYSRVFEDIKLVETSKEYDATGPIQWALKEKKKFDVFINCMHNKSDVAVKGPQSGVSNKSLGILSDYEKIVNVRNAKLISLCFTSKNFMPFEERRNYIHIIGLASEIPHLVHAFATSKFE